MFIIQISLFAGILLVGCTSSNNVESIDNSEIESDITEDSSEVAIIKEDDTSIYTLVDEPTEDEPKVLESVEYFKVETADIDKIHEKEAVESMIAEENNIKIMEEQRKNDWFYGRNYFLQIDGVKEIIDNEAMLVTTTGITYNEQGDCVLQLGIIQRDKEYTNLSIDDIIINGFDTGIKRSVEIKSEINTFDIILNTNYFYDCQIESIESLGMYINGKYIEVVSGNIQPFNLDSMVMNILTRYNRIYCLGLGVDNKGRYIKYYFESLTDDPIRIVSDEIDIDEDKTKCKFDFTLMGNSKKVIKVYLDNDIKYLHDIEYIATAISLYNTKDELIMHTGLVNSIPDKGLIQ